MKKTIVLLVVLMMVVTFLFNVSAAKPITLRYATWDYADRTASTDAFIAGVKKSFNINIELEQYPTKDYENVIKTKAVSGDAPDLIAVHGVTAGYGKELADAGTFTDISGLKSTKNFLQAAIDANRINRTGPPACVTVSTNVLGVIYNKDVFSSLKLNVPKNIDEFTAVCDTLKTAGIVPIAGGFKDDWTTQMIPFIAVGQFLQGPDHDALRKLANLEIKYSDPRFKKALAIQNDWAKKGYFPKNYLGSDINVASAMVGTGKAAMLVQGNWQYKTVHDADPKAHIGFFAMPMNQKGESITMVSTATGGICINAKSKNMVAAKKALDYYLSPEIQALVIKDLNGITTNTKVLVKDPFLAEVNAAMKSVSYVAPNWLGTDYMQPGIGSLLMKGFQAMLDDSSGMTIDKVTADADAATAEALAKEKK